ncbi:MAG: thioredoxin [Acidobacteria bacterium]|nr:thioredoxin [Acidobacteriota bacterium]
MSEKVKNVTDSNFEAEVLHANQPVLVDFWAAWCGPCLALAPTVEALAEQYTGHAKVVKLNVDENPRAAASYGVRGIPTLILFNQGSEVERSVGFTSKDSLVRLIDKHVAVAA